MALTDSQRDALVALLAAGGEGAIDRHDGDILAAGERLPFLADTWLRLVTLGLVAGAGPLRIRLTAAGEEAALPKGRRFDPRLLMTDNFAEADAPGS